MKNFIQIKIEIKDRFTNDLLIASLTDIGFEGFEEEANALLGYCAENDFDRDKLKELSKKNHFSFTEKTIPEQNWNALWESNFEPVIVNDFAVVRANFHQPFQNIQHEIIITPKMSFGTGHHATTLMMMQQMKRLDFKNKSVLDFGTGTGILAILAKQMGAENITAIDNDDWSIANAKENFEQNKTQGIVLLKDDKITFQNAFNVVLANINKNIILANFSSLISSLKVNSFLLLSGLLAEDESDILEISRHKNLKHLNTMQNKHWISILFAN